MTNAEHLIENAIICIEGGKIYEDFADARYNREMSSQTNIALRDVWCMAAHVVYTFKSSWVSDTVAYFQNEELFDSKMKEYIERFIYDEYT